MSDTQIPRLELPSGNDAWVEFHDVDDLTAGDLHKMRRRFKGNAVGEDTNAFMAEALPILIKTWNVPYLADQRTPEANPTGWLKLRMRDMRAIEDALQPFLNIVFKAPAAADGEPGSPPQPDSE